MPAYTLRTHMYGPRISTNVPRISTNVPRISTNLHESPRIPTNLHESPQIPTNLHEPPRISTNLHEFQKIMDLWVRTQLLVNWLSTVLCWGCLLKVRKSLRRQCNATCSQRNKTTHMLRFLGDLKYQHHQITDRSKTGLLNFGILSWGSQASMLLQTHEWFACIQAWQSAGVVLQTDHIC